MKAYWDSNVLVDVVTNTQLASRLSDEGGFTRGHSLSEVFSALTGKVHLKISAADAAKFIRSLKPKLEFVNLTEDEMLAAFDAAEAAGIRGGAIHDFLHAVAAKKAGAEEFLTLDRNDFNGLVPGLKITQV